MTNCSVPGVTAGELMGLVARGLTARGCAVQVREFEDERRLSVEYRGGRCELLVEDFGYVDMEFRLSADASLVADIAALLLTGKDEAGPRRARDGGAGGMSFRGIVGNNLRDRGFDVGLDVYEDTDRFEVLAELMITNPVAHPSATVRVSDDADIIWESDYPHEIAAITSSADYFAALARRGDLADSLVSKVTRAMSLASGADLRGSENRIGRAAGPGSE